MLNYRVERVVERERERKVIIGLNLPKMKWLWDVHGAGMSNILEQANYEAKKVNMTWTRSLKRKRNG